jgi:hypothetical protein
MFVTSDGRQFLIGVFSGTVDFDPGPGVAMFSAMGTGHDIFVSSFAADGRYLWTRTIRSNGDEFSADGSPQRNGGVVVHGSYLGTAEFIPGQPRATRTARGPEGEGFALRLTPTGEVDLLFTVPAAMFSNVSAVVTLQDGTLVAVGRFSGSLNFGDDGPNSGRAGGFVAGLRQIGSEPALEWGHTFLEEQPSVGLTSTLVMAADWADAIWVAGTFGGHLDPAEGPFTLHRELGAGEKLSTPPS